MFFLFLTVMLYFISPTLHCNKIFNINLNCINQTILYTITPETSTISNVNVIIKLYIYMMNQCLFFAQSSWFRFARTWDIRVYIDIVFVRYNIYTTNLLFKPTKKVLIKINKTSFFSCLVRFYKYKQ